MKEEQINPGFSNPIFELSEKEPHINTTEFLNAENISGEIKFCYDIHFLNDYIKLNVDVAYLLIASDRPHTITPIKNRYSYKVINRNEITGEELFIVLENCIKRLNLALQQEQPPLSNIPKVLANPLLEDNMVDLEKLAEKMNAHQARPLD